MIRVMIADDHAIVRAGLRALLGRQGDAVDIVAEASTVSEAVELARTLAPDVVLMDLRFSGDSQTGVDATRQIRSLTPAPHVLVVTNYDTDHEILRAIEAGASGYLLKDAPPDQLWAAVQAAATGGSTLPPAATTRLLDRLREPQKRLTPRELDVLRSVATGMSNRDVARTLFLSEGTVKSHLVQVFTKLDVKSRTAAVARARDLGLIGTDD